MLRLSRASQRERESERPSLLGESTSPFIGEGDGLTSKREKERECVRVLPSLVAHAIGYETIVGDDNTVHARCVWQVLPCSPGMVIVGAYNTAKQISAPTTLFGF